MIMQSLFSSLLGLDPSPASSPFPHSYLADLHSSSSKSDEYLDYDRLNYYQQEKFFTYKCPLPSLMDYLTINLSEAYERQ